MERKKEKLEHILRRSVKQAEEVLQVFEAISVFLTKWDGIEREKNENEEDKEVMEKNKSLPRNYLRNTFCNVLSSLDPIENADLVRIHILSTLKSIGTVECLAVLLEFLPAITKIATMHDSNTRNYVKSKKLKKDIISTFKDVFENEPNSLSHILQSFSTILEGTGPDQLLVSKDMFTFVIGILPKVPEKNLHIALKALIGYIENASDSRLVVHEMRKELTLLEKTDISDMVSMAIAFDEVIKGTNKGNELFIEEYLVVVEEIIDEQVRSPSNTVKDVRNRLLTFDFIMILLSKNKSPYRERILGIISDGFLVQSGLLSDLYPSKILELVNEGHNHTTETVHNFSPDTSLCGRFLESLVDFSMAILLTPLRCSIILDTEMFFSNVQSVILRVIFAIPQDFQLKLISTALDITEKLMEESQEKTIKNQNRLGMEVNYRVKICLNIYSFILSIACKKSQILISFKNRLVNYLMSDALHNIEKYDTLETLCTIVIKLAYNGTRNCQINLIMTCRALLFSTPMIETKKLQSQSYNKNSICRRIRGMVFMNTIISHCDLDEISLMTICKMLSRILVLPDSNVCILDPKIGVLGIKIIRRLQEQEKSNSLTGNELFQLITLVLSNSRVVHYSNETSKRFRTKPNTVLAYSEIPSFLSPSYFTTKQRKFRKMIFSFNALFTKESVFTQFSNWQELSSWIFKLFDAYLAICRTANWNPQAWIFAGIEIPAVSSTFSITGSREAKLLELMRSDFAALEGSQKKNSSFLVRLHKQFIELIKGTKNVSEKEAIVYSISRFTLSMLLAISVSTAVLYNAYDHFKGLFAEECRESGDAFRLIHCQMVKIYDLKRRCQSMERFFRKLGSRNQNVMYNRSKKRKKRNFNRPPSTQKTILQVRAELAAVQLKETLTRIFCSVDFIPSEVLWICLTDSSHDVLIISSLNNPNNKEKTAILSDVVDIRINLIEHLATGVISTSCNSSSTILAILNINPSMLRQYIARCLRLASFLLLKLQSVHDTNISDASIESLTKLTSEYLRLLCRILISKIDLDQSSEIDKDDFVYFFGLYLSLIGSKQPLDDAIHYKANNGTFTLNQFKILVSSFQDRIGCCHASIASQLLETLSIFAARSESSILHHMVDVHWSATFMSKHAHFVSSKNTTIDTPFALLKTLKTPSRSALRDYTDLTAEERRAHGLAVNLMTGCFCKSGERNLFLVHSMCRHWGLITLSPRRTTLFTDFLKTLLGKLSDFLKGVDGFVGQKIVSENKEESSDDDEDGEYFPPSLAPQISKLSIPTLGDFTCLTSSSYPIYFDMLLRMTVSSVAVFSVPGIMCSFKNPVVASRRLHPVYKLEQMIVVYGSLIKLYKDTFQMFPRFLLPSIIYTSKYMLDISLTKVHDYIEWRNSQPVLPPEDKNPRVFDMASTSFLKNLLDTLGLHVIGKLRAFCYAYSESAESQGERKTSVDKKQQLFFGKTAMPRVNSLSRKVEGALEFLCQTSSRYNTGNIKTKCTQQDTYTERVTKRSRFEPEESLLSDNSTTGDESSEKIIGTEIQEVETLEGSLPVGKSSHNHSTLSMSIGDYETEDSENDEISIDDESSSRSDAFGVSGNWGQDTSEEEIESILLVNR